VQAFRFIKVVNVPETLDQEIDQAAHTGRQVQLLRSAFRVRVPAVTARATIVLSPSDFVKKYL
jgi:hypothetical protein